MNNRGRLARTWSLFSSFFNVWIFNGNPDESISARCYREGFLEENPSWERGRKIVDKVFFFQPNHCYKSYKTDFDHAKALLRGCYDQYF